MIKAGFAETDIELMIGMDMTGFLIRRGCSEGIHDRLKIKALAINEDLASGVLIVCDLLGLDSAFVKVTAEKINAGTGIPYDNIIIACTHTHYGPASIFLQNCGEVEPSMAAAS